MMGATPPLRRHCGVTGIRRLHGRGLPPLAAPGTGERRWQTPIAYPVSWAGCPGGPADRPAILPTAEKALDSHREQSRTPVFHNVFSVVIGLLVAPPWC